MIKSALHNISTIGKKSVGLLLFIICSIAIYKNVLANEHWETLTVKMRAQLLDIHFFNWLVLAALMGCNYVIESIKWKRVVAVSNPISLFKSIQSVLVGQSFAFFTPNRVGEYAGRTLFLDTGNKLLGITQMAWASYAQLLMTILFGSIAFAIQIAWYPFLLGPWLIWIRIISPIIGLLALFVFFYKYTWKGRLGVINNMQIATKVKIELVWLSAIRYLIFLTQYIWVANMLKMDIATLPLLLSISILFLCLSILPTITLTELVVRGQLLLILLAPFYNDKWLVISMSSVIWVINFLVPAIIGTFLLLGYRLNR